MVFGLDKNLMVNSTLKEKTSCFISDVAKASRLRATTFLKEEDRRKSAREIEKSISLR